MKKTKKLTALLISTVFVVTTGVWTVAKISFENAEDKTSEIQVNALALDISDLETTTTINKDSDKSAKEYFQNGDTQFNWVTFNGANDSWIYVHVFVRAGSRPIPAGTQGLMTVWAGDEAIKTNDAAITRTDTEIPPGGMLTFRMLLDADEVMRIAGRKLQLGLSFLEDGNGFPSVKPDTTLHGADGNVTRAKTDNWISHAARSFASGSGTESDPFIISTPEQLAFLAKSVNEGNEYKDKYIKVTQELDLAGKMWTPIGSSENTPFSGNFNGGMVYIKNLVVMTDDEAPQGLFGVTNSGTIIDIGVIDVYVNGSTNVGAVVGKNLGSEIEHIFSTGYVIGANNVGGLIGTNAGRLFRSKTHVAVVGITNVGGVAGNMQEGSNIEVVHFNGNAAGLVNVGGFIGEANGGILSTTQGHGTVAGHGIIVGRINGNARFEHISYNLPDDTYSFAGGISVGIEPKFADCFYTTSSKTTDSASDLTLNSTSESTSNTTSDSMSNKRIDISLETASRITEKTINNIESAAAGTSIDPNITVDTKILYNNICYEALIPGQNMTIETNVNNKTSAPINTTLMIAAYNNGKMVDFKTTMSQSVPGNNGSRTFNLSYAVPNSGVDKVKVFVFDRVTMKPYAFAIELVTRKSEIIEFSANQIGQLISVPFTVSNATNLSNMEFRLSFNADDFDIFDERELTALTANLLNIQRGNGYLTFRYTGSVANPWRGIVNQVKLRAKRQGILRVITSVTN